MNGQQYRRRRGVILTPQGFQKLQAAKSNAETWQNAGNRYTLEALNEYTGLSVDTLMKVFKCESGVDKQTLKCCFRAFNLSLEPGDYFQPARQIEQLEAMYTAQSTLELEPEFPGSQVPLYSAFYVERFPSDTDCYKTIVQPGALIRIEASRRMGKTSLMARILDQVATKGYRTVLLNFQLADKTIFQDLNKFLQWFCASVGLSVQMPNRLANYWSETFGSKISSKMYFEQYLLAETTQPLVLGLDEVDLLFQYPEIADEFFGMLRTWHEEAKNREIWKRLRLIVAHSTQIYIPLNVNKSPFNVGLPIELRAFTSSQVQDLALRYGLDWSSEEAEQLIAQVGGHPYLVQLALYHIWHQDVTLEQLLQTSHISFEIYRNHLQQQLWHLQQHPELAIAFGRVVAAPSPVEIDLIQAFKLQRMGLVHLQGNQVTPICKLYAQYFRAYFSSNLEVLRITQCLASTQAGSESCRLNH
ncbi:AAA-like domain-containing protein [Gloeocapsopsis crepidinum LEGE 06123]|uniref:AAA-like domain-containing protein n=1 Tax=Gloeocapsopsis crepidinum LEGE 06123 TaxID=588587 RepID=A0ABR9UY12_9CHRO|nr:AAA-like domain-containing protein [Gloeocapsopsis crepidinum]MBE9192875.1 AAA-like domain-containing protein [Gloeocapsopsis crepidinum LEGE 06123]